MKIAVFTAITGGYDAPPKVLQPDPAISYILFVDSTVSADSVEAPWQVRRLPRIFADPQRDARRIKALPHLFLPDVSDIVVWIDANCEIKNLTAEMIKDMMGDAKLAAPPHKERDCIFAEAEALLAAGLFDSAPRITRQMSAYEIAGLPRQIGLHHLNFLIRRHLDPLCILFSNEWWKELCTHSKREQLSFDFIRWKLPQVGVGTIPICYEDNSMFRSTSIHRLPHRVVSEHLGTNVRRNDLDHKFLAADYLPQYDIFPLQFSAHLVRLNEMISASGESIESNLCFFQHQRDLVHSPPDPRRGLRRETFLRSLAGRSKILDIGFKGGYAALLALTQSKASYTSIDDHTHSYGKPIAQYLQAEFPGRFQVLNTEAGGLSPQELGNYDMIRIDGGLEIDVLTAIVAAAIAGSKPDTLILFEDIYLPWVKHIASALVRDGLLAGYGNLETWESGAYTVLEHARRDQSTFLETLKISLLNELQRGGSRQETQSNFMVEFLRDLGPANGSDTKERVQERSIERADGLVADTVNFEAGQSMEIDDELIEQIRQIRYHPWMIFRNAGESSSELRFSILKTENETAEFASAFRESPFAASKLLAGLVHAIQLEISEAADLLHSWVESSENQSEQIYLGLPEWANLPTYYNYPIFEMNGEATKSDAALRARQLFMLLESYELADGNNRSRFALVEALALSVVRYLGQREQYDQAAKIIGRAFRIHPQSRLLREAVNKLDERSRRVLK